ncbi:MULTISPECIES: DUF2790 domain-containing protein [Pseudomonas]|uniref:DUF2790 domain-containing protein n=1 Tax=Pseudomonas putida TaxID=303 RepID=A0A1Y3KZ29_PSEPU|nr:hypothetical protein AA098_07250 [Pseudomonas sp. JY-Q]MBH3469740.1 DUF2790 domain-containing protein [Pseudomonas putida]MDM1713503.1 DUF2790 domain-containing protein [Pseudomonas sp. 165]PJI71362.1 DUF2790 domain-containing protein [Pseudomonas sp. MR 02]CAI3796739.1 hypothetical protein DBADOPDK_01586 [Pseudomonas sp. MM223]CAI3797118.1 hypothetical protein GLGCALEP_01628 [Pseudomonas sp. MM221]
MKLFKALIAASFVMMGSQVALADEPVVEHYTYSSHPDIAKVVRQDPIPDVCGVVPVQMTYIDHQGQQHTMEYSVMGNGCHDN